jgi:hypothetical protein
MRYFITILSFAAAVTLTACRSTQQSSAYDPAEQLAAARIADVPLPAATPFDAMPDARAAYLDSYRDGYRSGLVSFNVLIGQPNASASYYAARTNGWHAGASAGFSAHLQSAFTRTEMTATPPPEELETKVA